MRKEPVSLFNVALVIIVACVLLAMAHGYRECHAAGGKYLRSLFWFECVT